MRIIILFLALSLVLTEDSSSKVFFSSALLTRMANSIVPLINKEAAELTIPRYKGKIKGIDVSVGNVKKDIRVKPEAFKFSFSAPNLITISLNEVYCHFHVPVQVKKYFINTTAKFSIKVKSFNFKTTLALTRKIAEDGLNYVPRIEVKKTELNYDLDIKVKGKILTAILGLFEGIVKEIIKTSVDRLIKENLSKMVGTVVNNKAKKILPIFQIKPNLFSRVSVDSEPRVELDNVLSFGAGVSFFNDKEGPAPLSTMSESPDFDPESNEIQVILGEDSANSALKAFLEAYPVGVWLDNQKINNSRFDLTTPVLSGIFKGITDKYGREDVKLHIRLIKAPKIKQFTAQPQLTAQANVEFFVVGGAEDGSDASFANVQTEVEFGLSAHLEKGLGTAKIKDFEFGKLDSQSEFEVDTFMLELILQVVAKYGSAFVNKRFLRSINIPRITARDFYLAEPTLRFGDGFIHTGITPLLRIKKANK